MTTWPPTTANAPDPRSAPVRSRLTRRDWWVGVLIVAGALLVHAAWPRYAFEHAAGSYYRVFDRWTGTAAIQPYQMPQR